MLLLENFLKSLNIKDTTLVNPTTYTAFKTLLENSNLDGIRFKIELDLNSEKSYILSTNNEDENTLKDKDSFHNIVDIYEFNLENYDLFSPHSYIPSVRNENNSFVHIPFSNNETILFPKCGLVYSKLKIQLKDNQINSNFSFNAILLKNEHMNTLNDNVLKNNHNCIFKEGKYYYKCSNIQTIPCSEFTENDIVINKVCKIFQRY